MLRGLVKNLSRLNLRAVLLKPAHAARNLCIERRCHPPEQQLPSDFIALSFRMEQEMLFLPTS